MQVCNCANTCFCVCVSISVQSYFSDSERKKNDICYFFVFGNCHLYQYYVMLGFQLRYYKGHTFLCQSNFTLFFPSVDQTHLFCFFFCFQSHISHGIPGAQVSQITTVLVFHPFFLRGGRATDASLEKKKTIISMNE